MMLLETGVCSTEVEPEELFLGRLFLRSDSSSSCSQPY